jgi:hypothetical protein
MGTIQTTKLVLDRGEEQVLRYVSFWISAGVAMR